jgi:ribosomal protein S18 acetylase RimI-like enzyme
MTITIAQEAPDSPAASVLIGELDELLTAAYDAADRHGYSVEKLKRQGVHFFVVRCDGAPAGCGGVQLFDATTGDVAYGELKRMYVRPQFRGRGLGRRLVDHLSAVVRDRGWQVVRLETGIHQTDAIALYEACGFERIAPFADYPASPVSLCFEKRLTS